MKTVTVKLHAFMYDHALSYLSPKDLNNPKKVAPHIHFNQDMTHYQNVIPMGTVEIRIDIPDSDRIVQGAVAALRMKQANLRDDARKKCKDLEVQINNILALPAPDPA